MRSSSSASEEIPLHFMGPESSMKYLQHILHVSWDRWSTSTPVSFLFEIRFNILIPSTPISSNWSLFSWWLSKKGNSFSDQVSCLNLEFLAFCLAPVPKFILSAVGLFSQIDRNWELRWILLTTQGPPYQRFLNYALHSNSRTVTSFCHVTPTICGGAG